MKVTDTTNDQFETILDGTGDSDNKKEQVNLSKKAKRDGFWNRKKKRTMEESVAGNIENQSTELTNSEEGMSLQQDVQVKPEMKESPQQDNQANAETSENPQQDNQANVETKESPQQDNQANAEMNEKLQQDNQANAETNEKLQQDNLIKEEIDVGSQSFELEKIEEKKKRRFGFKKKAEKDKRKKFGIGKNKRKTNQQNVSLSKAKDAAGKDKPVIEVKGLRKIYTIGTNKVRALNGVDFKVYEGEFCAIVGTSGSGKSTLLNMLAGLEKPSKGEVIIAGQHIEKMNEKQLVKFRRENVGFIFQSFNLIGTMTALENIALPLTFRGMPKWIRWKRAVKLLKLVGLKEHANHRPNQMSGGQQQRVGMARALVVNPKIVFADEPTGNLDSRTSKEMMQLMRKVVNEQHKTLVMVTHDDSLAAIADKIIRIVDGKIVNIEDKRMKSVEDKKNEENEKL